VPLWLLALGLIGIASLPVAPAWAGGGPENVLLLVNSNSVTSKTIANHYIQLRKIPPTNVVYVDWRGGLEECQGAQFRAKILNPAIAAIRERRLANQIDYIVYSCDFPWRVHLKSLYKEDEKFSRAFQPIASTTGATYLWQYIRDQNPAVILPVVNWYVAKGDGENDTTCQRLGNVESRGFRSTYAWDRDGRRTTDPSQGQSYFLSTMLGVTTGRGNSVDEVLSYLRRSAAADATRPRGTIYFMKNNDIRSKTRHNCYDEVAGQLLRLGVSARVVPGKLPLGANDVLGIMTGTADFDLAKSSVTIQPGAICDHLTSLGGDLRVRAGQTPLTEFLRHGAAGASGTVIEPMALQVKFPLPSLFLHYARGCSLAESFYQSVAGPYQLLIVGDPLCQPWAIVPAATLPGISPGQEVQGVLTLRPTATTLPSRRVALMELYVDGRLVVRSPPDHPLQLDTAKLPDGYHEFRIVAVDGDPIENRGRLIVPVQVNNHGAKVELSITPQSNISATDKVRITARQPGASAIVIRHNRREVARLKGESGEVEVLAATFGRGPVALQAESEGQQPAISPPLRLDVQ
jgi:hypothetical protein